MGFSPEYIQSLPRKLETVTFLELTSYFKEQSNELEERIKEQVKINSSIISTKSEDVRYVRKEAETITNSINSVAETKSNVNLEVLPKDESIITKQLEEKKEELGREVNYGLEKSPNEKGFLYWFQKKAAAEILVKIKEGKKGILLLAGTGTGKTYIIGAVARRLWDSDYHEGKTFSHIPYIYVTRVSVVPQASRVFSFVFNVSPVNDCEIFNIETLRSKGGEYWIIETKQEKVEGGELKVWYTYKWKPNIQPCVFFFDESQAAKNSYSVQHQVVSAYNDLRSNVCLISISATPFTRVSEAKVFAVSTHKTLDHLGFPKGTILTNENWPAYAAVICGEGTDPTEYNQAAVERLMKDLDSYIVRVRNVRPQFEAINKVKIIPFETEDKKQFYVQAWERFLKEKAKMEQEIDAGLPFGRHMILVSLLKFRMAAEFCHAEGFAKEMLDAVKDGKAAVCACNFKNTIIEIVKILNENYNIPRDQISLIWGGGQTQLTKKMKEKQKIKAKAKMLESMGVDTDELLEDLALDEVEDRELQELPAHLRLGAQSPEERQAEIDKFQNGKSLFCLYTFRAGGVGLSLHHSDEATTFKCRRKESGYAFEEDIPKVPVRPRKTVVSLTYNAIELVQGVGRAPRLTSLSTTEQNVYAYASTVEVDVANIVSRKLKCLSSVVKQHESWQDIILGADKPGVKAKLIQQALASADKQIAEHGEDKGGLVEESED
jgi:hypothetical protein